MGFFLIASTSPVTQFKQWQLQRHPMPLSMSFGRSIILSDSKRATISHFVSHVVPLRDTSLIVYLSGFIFAGALFGFVLARLQYLSIDGKFKAGSSPGEWYWLRSGFRKVGITLHLATILPAGLLVVLQVSCCMSSFYR